MDDFLRVLIISIKTVDGTKNSLEKVQNELFQQKVNSIRKQLKVSSFNDQWTKINRKA